MWVHDYKAVCHIRSTKVITVRDTPPYGHAPTYQISLTYLERQKCNGADKKILLLFSGHNIFVFRERLLYRWSH
jgi:hypothetical protein